MTLPAGSPLRPGLKAPAGAFPRLDWDRESLWKPTAPLVAVDEKSVAQCVADCAEATPGAAALVDGARILDYRDLDRRASQLARQLQSLGVGREVLVGICLERSVSLLVVALGVFKAGGAFVPLDPAYPKERLETTLNDAQPRVVVTRPGLAELLPRGPWVCVTLDGTGEAPEDEGKFTPPSLDDLAYVIYTSGSTGTPKGVEVTHGSLLNLIAWHQQAFNVGPGDRATHLASPSFDASIWEVWPYLTMGASVSLPADSVRSNPEALRDWLIAQSITISFVPTPMAERLLALPWPADAPLRLLLTGGDMLHRYPPSGLPFQLINNYGPTESTVVATSGLVAPGSGPSAAPPVGRAIAGTEILILDENRQAVSPGAVGEIYIGGAALARGYRHQPKATAEKFITHPTGGGASDRLYQSGDLGRCLPDGQIELVGRADEQLKIRGFRIEPNEITAALGRHPEVEASLAVARADKDGEKSLVVYVVLRGGSEVTAGALRDFLGAKLPEYMLPAAFVRVESFPLTANGKIDRAALPPPASCNTLRDATPAAPQSPVEMEVARILASLLDMESVARDDNFFLLGGHSLMGTQLIVQLRGVFGVEMTLTSLFDHPTVGGIAEEIEKLGTAGRRQSAVGSGQ